MGTNPICTSVEQSKVLIKLGISEETADHCYVLRRNSEPRLSLLNATLPSGMLNSIPAWSLSALVNLLPPFIEEKQVEYCLTMTTADRVVYWNPEKDNLFETTQDNLLDAVVETIVWLVNENHI